MHQSTRGLLLGGGGTVGGGGWGGVAVTRGLFLPKESAVRTGLMGIGPPPWDLYRKERGESQLLTQVAFFQSLVLDPGKTRSLGKRWNRL